MAAFSVATSGATSFQWRKDGANIAGATSATLVIQGASPAQAGTYMAIATNSVGTATSTAATLTVSTNANDPGRLINFSILIPLAANETMTMGTVLGGTGTSGARTDSAGEPQGNFRFSRCPDSGMDGNSKGLRLESRQSRLEIAFLGFAVD